MKIRKLLIANRGEIAVRIARTAREMGIRTVGVYSEVDSDSLHVHSVDEAYPIGPSAPAESYLRQDKILDVAVKSGVDAVHPGYGFHSEKADFAQRVLDAGFVWVGPPPAAIEAMGSKIGARSLMLKAGVPVVPGTEGAVASWRDAQGFARRAGYPVLLKAVAGGGGKGMRVVEKDGDMLSAFESAARESTGAFADGSIYVEKFLPCPRHIEIQIFADSRGNIIHLGERDCTLQRRHQKIVEESSSPVVSPQLRARLGETAIAAARACGYVNAGTIEMLLDADEQFYFLEMNTRLQVEHPVTEEVTGLDLVALQLLIASGEKLTYSQNQIVHRGHAIEVRVYSEDVPNGFLPSTGKLSRLRGPSGPGIREDSGYREGDEVSRYYDPMISKLIARAESRPAAIQRMIRALESYEIAGIRTNIAFCRHILKSEEFARAKYSTQSADNEFLDSYRKGLSEPMEHEALVAAAIATALMEREQSNATSDSLTGNGRPTETNWKRSGRDSALRVR